MRTNGKCTAFSLCIAVAGFTIAGSARAEILVNLKGQKQNPSVQMCMGIAGGANGGVVKDGAKIVVWDCNGADDQIWSQPQDPVLAPWFYYRNFFLRDLATDGSSPACIQDGWINNTVGDKGAQLGIAACAANGTSLSQQWIFDDAGENDPAGFPCYKIYSGYSWRAVGVANAQSNPVQHGMAVIVWDSNSSDDQIWCVHPNPPKIIVS
ncbi:MAG TPA: RICIN domain-containing protein [Polyangiaceae bacterium]|nr:RICIN domain-containing protein [Polyangiaceae bacterium]